MYPKRRLALPSWFSRVGRSDLLPEGTIQYNIIEHDNTLLTPEQEITNTVKT